MLGETKMPLVISHKAKSVSFVTNEEVLGEILGHSNFDGEDWAVGDRIVFEDGTGAFIERHASDPFYVWSEPAPLDLREAVAEAARYDQRVAPASEVLSWQILFERFSSRPPKESLWHRWFTPK
jgi:hypothetical protein